VDPPASGGRTTSDGHPHHPGTMSLRTRAVGLLAAVLYRTVYYLCALGSRLRDARRFAALRSAALRGGVGAKSGSARGCLSGELAVAECG